MQIASFDAFRTAAEGDASRDHRHRRHHHGDEGGRRPFGSTIHIPVSDGFMLHLMILFKLIMDSMISAIQTSWEWITDVIACFDFLLSPLMEEDVLIQLSIALIILDRSCASCLQIEQHLIQRAQEQQRQDAEALRQQMSGRQSHQLLSSSLETDTHTSISPSSFFAALINMLDQAVLVYSKEAAAATTKSAVAGSTKSLWTNDRIMGQDSVSGHINGNDSDCTLPLVLMLFGFLALVFSYYCMSMSSSSMPRNRDSHSSWLLPSSLLLPPSPVSTTANHFLHGMVYSNGGGGVFGVEQYHNTTVLYMLLTLFCIEGVLLCFGSIMLGYMVIDAFFTIYHNIFSLNGGSEDMSLSSPSLFRVLSTTRVTLWDEVNDCPPIITTFLALWGLCLLTSRWVRWQLYQSLGD